MFCLSVLSSSSKNAESMHFTKDINLQENKIEDKLKERKM